MGEALLIKKILFHGSYLVFPILCWALWRVRQRRRPVWHLAWAGLCLLFIWARFIEPQWIHLRESTVAGTGIHADVVLISDIHLGIYKDTAFLKRVVERINALPAHSVLIAGDFTYEPEERSLRALFAPLGELRAPVYAVLGNHDQQAPGPDIDASLREALRQLGVQVVEQTSRAMSSPAQPASAWRLAGLGDHWGGNDDPAFLRQVLRQGENPGPTLLLMHNPDSSWRLHPQDATLVLAGHTHCGQVRLPGLYRHAIPSSHGFDCGLEIAQTPQGPVRVFISPGLGEIGLPLRFLNPPTIDWLHLRP